MSVKLFVALSLCGACAASIPPQPPPPDPPVGEFDIHSRLEGVSLDAPDGDAEYKRMRVRIAGVHSTQELLTRFVTRARRAGAVAVSHLAIDAVVFENREFQRCAADVVAKEEERLVEQTKTLPSYVETTRTNLFVFDSETYFIVPRTIHVVSQVEKPGETVTYKQPRSVLRTEFSNVQCQPVEDLDSERPNVVTGRVYFGDDN